MKKKTLWLTVLALTLITAFTLSACGGGKTENGTPSAPQNFTAAAGDRQVTLTWAAPSDTGDSDITKYEVSKDNGGTWTNAGLATSYTFTGLTNGTQYTFQVRAVNDGGNGTAASKTAAPAAAGTGTEAFEYNWNYILSHLPSEYSIIYLVKSDKSGTGGTIPITIISTPAGYYFEGETGMEKSLLYIKYPDGFKSCAYKRDEGLFVWDQITYGPLENLDMIFKANNGTYMIPWATQSGLIKGGSQTIAGRACDVYTYSVTNLDIVVTFTYCIDKETGVCLKMSAMSSAPGATTTLDFECSEFKTTGVTLPPYRA